MCIKSIEISKIKELKDISLKQKQIYYKGNLDLLKKQKISIVGSKKPNSYAKEITHQLASKLSKNGICIVSGGAIGVDAIAHKAATPKNTIMVAATGLDKRYPSINKNLIKDMEKEGLVISQFKEATPSSRYNFPLRNQIIVALGEVLIVTYADLNSGSLRSIEYALKMKKDIYVLSHRIGESLATNKLLSENKAKPIYDIDEFLGSFIELKEAKEDELLNFCSKNPTYDEVLNKFGSKVFEYELGGEIFIKNGIVYVS